MKYLLKDIASYLGAELRGDPNCEIRGLQSLERAGAGQLSFLASKNYEMQLASTQAEAVIVEEYFAAGLKCHALVVADPYLAYARISAWFAKQPSTNAGIHPSAVVAKSAIIAADACIGAQVTIGEDVHIGSGVSIGPACVIGDGTRIGADTTLHANVSVYHDVVIGSAVVVHSGAVIGADGFGFAPDGGKWVKVHQLGSVEIGDRVEIGACTTIDRGALGNTVIADGVILDNHVQIAHNVRVGENTAMAAYAGIAGSTRVGKNCVFAGQSGAVGHVEIGDGVIATARCTLSKSISKPGSYSSGLLMSETEKWRKNAARFSQLDDIARRLRRLEKSRES